MSTAAYDDDGHDAFLAEMAEREAFEARVPAEAWKEAARALGFGTTEKELRAFKDYLVPFLYNSFSGGPALERPRDALITKARKLRDALATVRDAIPPRGSSMDLPWTASDFIDGSNEKLLTTLARLYLGAEKRLSELEAAPVRRGRRPKTVFRDFIPDLIWLYEVNTGERAKKPNWRPDSGIYGGWFYRFAVAVWKIIRAGAPQYTSALPKTEVALAQELQRHWPFERTNAG